MALSRTAVATGDIGAVVSFFVTACGGEKSSVEFLESVVSQIKSKSKTKRPAENHLDDHPNKSLRKCQSINDFEMHGKYVNDSLDDTMTTLALRIPNDKLLISYIIGTGGATLNEVESKTGTKIRIERSQQGPVSHRVIFVVGSIKNVLHAFRHVTDIIGSRPLNIESDSSTIEIPNDFVSRLIGRSGTVVKKIETDTATKVYIQQERDMLAEAAQVTIFGRCITIKGHFAPRMLAIYHILRLMAPESIDDGLWKGSFPAPLTLPPAHMGGSGHVPGHFPVQPPPAPPGNTYHPHAYTSMSSYSVPQMIPIGAGGGISTSTPTGGMPGHPPLPHHQLQHQYVPPTHPGSTANAAAPTAHMMMIPGKAVSALIGSKGVFVSEIEQSSGTKIQIEKTDSPQGERLVRVIGAPGGQSVAMQLIQAKVQEWKKFQIVA